jgi:malate permease and related proteins
MTGSLITAMACIFIMTLPGVISGKFKWVTPVSTKEISLLVIRFFYPMMIFTAIYRNFPIKKIIATWQLPVSIFCFMAFGGILGLIVTKIFKIRNQKEKNAFLLQCSMNNYSFLPISVIVVLYAKNSEPAVAQLIFSTLGAELAVWTIGVLAITGQKASLNSLKHLLSPPLVALYCAIILRAATDYIGCTNIFMGTEKQTTISLFLDTFEKVGFAAIPLAMFVSGARMSFLSFHSLKKPVIWFISLMRLIIIPLSAIFLISLIPLEHQIKNIFIIVAVMPVSFASIMLSEIYGGDKDTITSSVLLSHILAVVTIPLFLSVFLKDI